MQASVEIHHVDDVQLQLPFGHHEGQANAATNGRLCVQINEVTSLSY